MIYYIALSILIALYIIMLEALQLDLWLSMLLLIIATICVLVILLNGDRRA